MPVLIVDDEEPIRQLLRHLLEAKGYVCTLAGSGKEARQKLNEQKFALVLCDVQMPEESGLDLVRHVLREHPQTAVVMVTGLDDPQLADIALEIGAYGYMIKPFKLKEVLINVSNALRRHRLEIENQAHQEKLEQMVLARTLALRHAMERLERAAEETIHRLAIVAEFRNDDTAQHIQRMSQYCALLARRTGLEDDRCELIRLASSMHDLGKIGTPDSILLKPGRLTPEEFQICTRHTENGYRILTGSEAELLQLAATIAWTHHERFDGSGYPRKLAGGAIPQEGRIAAIADAFDALTSKRAYKPAFPVEEAIDLMRQGRGRHFDPAMLDLFLSSMNEVLAVRERYTDRRTAGQPATMFY